MELLRYYLYILVVENVFCVQILGHIRAWIIGRGEKAGEVSKSSKLFMLLKFTIVVKITF